MSMASILIVLFQDNYEDRPTTDPEPGTAFSGYIDFFADIMLLGGAFLAIFSAYRLYQNAMLRGDNILNGTTNLVLGMIFCLIVGTWIKLTF